ncbi:MAG TPA: DUF1641 domain-containing protein [Acidimicrobiia bacterium]|nr:DUF1641 domain-containing protein [Acidimicrobiia bacterium]
MTAVDTLAGNSQLEQMAEQLRVLVEEAEERRRLRDSYSELMADLSPVVSQSMSVLTHILTEAEDRGYAEFARGGVEVADRVATSFTYEDVNALGDNIVLILETIKEMTQPEVMQMLRSTFRHIHDVDEPVEPPSLLALLRQLRTVEARRGLYRLIVALRSLGEAAPEELTETKETQA